MIDLSVAYDKLAQFQTSDDLAEFFRGEGIQGIPRHDMQCPIARWVTKVTGIDGVSVTNDEVAEYHRPTWKMIQGFETTSAMETFVERFDEDEFPDLEEEEEARDFFPGWVE